NPPALIILDVMMSEESGIQIYRLLKFDKQLKRIPVIMLSAIDRDTFSHYQKFESSQPGQSIPEPEAFLEKPPEAEELINIVLELTSMDKKP
ncbi:MAG: response regulator, partial [Desulfobacterium sp.]|nr:response regulator [Desulfobacterium sp.]